MQIRNLMDLRTHADADLDLTIVLESPHLSLIAVYCQQLEKSALNRGRTDNISLTHDLDLDLRP